MGMRTICAIIFLLFSGLAIAGLAGGAAVAAQDDGPLLVFAASSLAGVLEPALAGSEEGAKARIAYAGSGPLARQIAAGARADLFISANRQWVEYLAQNGLAEDVGARVILANALVIAAAPGVEVPDGPLGKAGLASLLDGQRLAMGNPAYVPAGGYGKLALEWYGVWEAVRARAVLTDSVRATTALVARGEVPYGLIYLTDARAAGLEVVVVLDEDSHPPVRYAAVPVRGGRTGRALRFLAELAAPAAQEVFAAFGFPQLK
ncbi:hypothetical protein MNBD_ALPHA09-1024 [hydrothermal vent metagenome]|uniref:Molybdenum ABC transporter, periplasmic molybdenum-binding protein ModA (TC 3.A.1.8.1) n=1 Tax=hydrothermal vent metagenome TaxID=652676 RepID=A0A3B0TQQ5_9ZZZZ